MRLFSSSADTSSSEFSASAMTVPMASAKALPSSERKLRLRALRSSRAICATDFLNLFIFMCNLNYNTKLAILLKNTRVEKVG